MNAIANRKKLYILDKDGTICKSVIDARSGKSHAPNRLTDQEYWEDVTPVIDRLRSEGHQFAVASNQGGVAFGIFSQEEAEALVNAAAIYIGASSYRVCFYHPSGKVAPYNADSYNRKPAPGMLIELMNELGFTPENTVMVGDWESDKQAADMAGTDFCWAHVFFGRVNPFADRLHSMMDVK